MTTKPPRWNWEQMANNARKNKGKTPWREGRHIPPRKPSEPRQP